LRIRVLRNSCCCGNLYALCVAEGFAVSDAPLLFHYIQSRDALEGSAKELFEVVASGKVRINVNQRFALKDAAEAHKALEARATSGSAILTI
jgi:NADPH2:quinone reductase